MKNAWVKNPVRNRDVNEFGLSEGQKQSQQGYCLVHERPDVGHRIRGAVIG